MSDFNGFSYGLKTSERSLRYDLKRPAQFAFRLKPINRAEPQTADMKT
jgi:hypothetical protein